MHIVNQGLSATSRQGVNLIDQHHHVFLAGTQAAQIALVQGGVGIFLRVHNPNQQVS